MKIKSLKYAEKFITPFLLTIFPVNEKPIKWGDQKTVTLHIFSFQKDYMRLIRF